MTNGPLRFYPKVIRSPHKFSHGKTNAISEEMPDFYKYIESEITRRGISWSMKLNGDVLLWHAQLMHGGEKIAQLKQSL